MAAAAAETDRFDVRCRRLVADLGLAAPEDVVGIRPLAGGVASDIGVIDLGTREICVKFALARLKVAAEWLAPTHRNRAEYQWLRFAGSVAPQAVPQLFGWSEAEDGFAMEFLDGPDIRLWKSAMLQGRPPQGEAAAVGALLGRIHAASAKADFASAAFQNADDFRALRLEPYLTFTAGRHPALASRLIGLADQLYASRQVLVHGDVSPKNILFRGDQPIILDAECATMGDPAFDVAFCLNHLVLKAIHLPETRAALLASVHGFWAAYSTHIDWESDEVVERRVCELLPAFMLARIDGKSPVEYLIASERDLTRDLSIALIESPSHTLLDLVSRIAAGIELHEQH